MFEPDWGETLELCTSVFRDEKDKNLFYLVLFEEVKSEYGNLVVFAKNSNECVCAMPVKEFYEGLIPATEEEVQRLSEEGFL